MEAKCAIGSGMRKPTPTTRADTVVVLDFETTGLSPRDGDRAIEIGAVRLERGQIVDRFQQLINPGFRVSRFIEQYTGITNGMLQRAPDGAEVMAQFADFMGDHNLVAHNASFDRRFLEAELNLIERPYTGTFACSMLVARRVYPQAPNHKLGSLVAFKNLPTDGVFHRALADCEMTARLWLQMLADLTAQYGLSPISFELMRRLSRQSKDAVAHFLRNQTGG